MEDTFCGAPSGPKHSMFSSAVILCSVGFKPVQNAFQQFFFLEWMDRVIVCC